MTATASIARGPASVKAAILSDFSRHLDNVFEQADGVEGARTLEESVWRMLLDVGSAVLAALLATACWSVTRQELEPGETVRLRLDKSYTVSVTTTLGTLEVPLFAYRGRGGVTHAPARRVVFPLHPRCRSSELCLEWEATVGCEVSFRRAQSALTYFTHGAVKLEDTTIRRHLVAIGGIVGREWQYRTPEAVRKILRTKATRDIETGQPLLYVSSDAHALRRYVDETWNAEWKMKNGIRLWCVDRHSGRTIHLGGEYTWGDCHEVAAIFPSLRDEGYIPKDGDFGEGVVAQVVLLTGGQPWLKTHLLPALPSATVCILDAYHLLEHAAAYAAARFGRGKPKARKWITRTRKTVLGRRRRPRRARSAARRGHTKRREQGPQPLPRVIPSDHPDGAVGQLFDDLLQHTPAKRYAEAHEELLGYLARNSGRADYPAYQARGMQIGSGAMESLHRIASQQRLKIPGARWLPQTTDAIVALRMMRLAERWDAFWHGPGCTARLDAAFVSHTTQEEAA